MTRLWITVITYIVFAFAFDYEVYLYSEYDEGETYFSIKFLRGSLSTSFNDSINQ